LRGALYRQEWFKSIEPRLTGDSELVTKDS
jgi:hypothetical protein